MSLLKKIYLFLFLIIFLLFLGNFSLATEKERPLEVEYPKVPGVEIPKTVKTPLPEYVKYIFNFAIIIGGILAFSVLVYGGVRYLLSAGNPAEVSRAKEMIFGSILGLVILLASFLILQTIHPQLVTLVIEKEPEAIAPPTKYGVALCRGGECTPFYTKSVPDLGKYAEKDWNSIKFSNPPHFKYGAVVHEERGHRGTCQVFINDGTVKLPKGKPSSIFLFAQAEEGYGKGVIFYELADYKEKDEKDNPKWVSIAYKKAGSPPKPEGKPVGKVGEKQGSRDRGRSIFIDGYYLAIVFEGENGTKECEIFTKSDPQLADNEIAECIAEKWKFWEWTKIGCFRSFFVLPYKI